ncbi:MAG: cryptochrome/photolyase family protein [Chitinophagia bacterium]|nr:cryptochrome/photolyase family protein [Chitinophagia bacterium]
MQAFLIFPHQLFKNELPVKKQTPIYLIEQWLFFSQYTFHQQKILLHRSSMKYYEQYLTQAGHKVIYIEHHESGANMSSLIKELSEKGIKQIQLYFPNDNWLQKETEKACNKYHVAVTYLPSPNFINSHPSDVEKLGTRKPFYQTGFYTQQRKDRNILLTTNGEPLGGQWTYDTENRKKIPSKTSIPPMHFGGANSFIQEAISYTKQYFAKNPGSTAAPFSSNETEQYYPCTHEAAEIALERFITHKLRDFGVYEDAMQMKETTLFHSVISPLLNIGLLNPTNVINQLIIQSEENNIPLNSVEGIVRQLLGWREFVQLSYQKIGSIQRTKNFWGFSHAMPEAFYDGTTGIPPIDSTIQKLLRSGYNHHIERLMVLGNFMLLCEIHPDHVYQWFMEMYIDAYDWVMVPNVYGMSQYSDGGMITSKPYIAGSNYLMKMGDFPKGEWQAIWDGLFWRFLTKNRTVFAKNPRWAMLITTWDKREEAWRKEHLINAERFLKNLHGK